MARFNELALSLSAVVGLSSLACFADASAGSVDDSALGNNSSREYFSVPAFFITFRETIEVGPAVLIATCWRLGVCVEIARMCGGCYSIHAADQQPQHHSSWYPIRES